LFYGLLWQPAAALEVPRRHAVDLLEDAGEMVGVVEADGAADGLDRLIGTQQQFCGVVHAQAGEESRGGLSSVLVEKARKVFRAHMAGTGRLSETAHTRVVRRQVIPATVEDMTTVRP
jgi:hypothetical protein